MNFNSLNMDPSWAAKFDRMLDNTEVTRNELMAYKTSNDARVNKLETKLKNDVNILETKLKDIVARLDECEKKSSSAGVNSSSTSLEAERELLKQQALKNNVCISGIPSSADEDVDNIVKKMFTAVGITSKQGDVLSAYRTKSRPNSDGLIIVKFASFDMKLVLLEAKKKKKQLSLHHFDLGNKDAKVFLSNQLTPFYSSLFYTAKKAIADGFFVSRWLGNQGVNVKLHDGTIHRVKSEAEIISLTGDIVPQLIDLAVTSDEEDAPAQPQPALKPSRTLSSAQLSKKTEMKKRKERTSENENSPPKESKRGKQTNKPSKPTNIED